MWNCSYEIVMQTPLGEKQGTAEVAVGENDVKGTLNILKKRTPFVGTVDEKGQCRISGTLETLLRAMPYEAEGRITKETLSLEIRSGGECFHATGRASGHK